MDNLMNLSGKKRRLPMAMASIRFRGLGYMLKVQVFEEKAENPTIGYEKESSCFVSIVVLADRPIFAGPYNFFGSLYASRRSLK